MSFVFFADYAEPKPISGANGLTGSLTGTTGDGEYDTLKIQIVILD